MYELSHCIGVWGFLSCAHNILSIVYHWFESSLLLHCLFQSLLVYEHLNLHLALVCILIKHLKYEFELSSLRQRFSHRWEATSTQWWGFPIRPLLLIKPTDSTVSSIATLAINSSWWRRRNKSLSHHPSLKPQHWAT